MEEESRKIQNIRNLDIQYLKNEKESLIKSNHGYSEQIGRMELEISDLKAMLKAAQNENKALISALSKSQNPDSQSIQSLKRQIDQITQEKLKSEKNLKENFQNSEFDDLTEEVTELREELLYLKGEFIPKLEHQVKNSKLLISELEAEVSELVRQNESYQSLIEESMISKGNKLDGSVVHEAKRDFLQPISPTEYLKEENIYRSLKAKPKLAQYVPSTRRMDKSSKTPEVTLSLSKAKPRYSA